MGNIWAEEIKASSDISLIQLSYSMPNSNSFVHQTFKWQYLTIQWGEDYGNSIVKSKQAHGSSKRLHVASAILYFSPLLTAYTFDPE